MWDSEGRFVAPDNFLPTAERYQLMVDIDRYVLSTYLSTVTQYPDHVDRLHIAHVNLAGGSLNHLDFQQTLKQMIVEVNFPWSKLALEVTETSAVGDLSQAIDFIKYCQRVGIEFALDDFGTGMSSFEYLKHLPFDVVKIDGSFIKDMHKDPIDLAVIRYIHEICQLRQQETVAEYVETAEDVAALRQIGITYAQGYYLGKPKPLREWLGG
jgi:EAL domain-containing protein (putative c-di-GMP-specific phosphodiesterase class I)